MQTFLPYASFERSLRCLDTKRLGKQRVETLQLIRAILGETKGWSHHPAAVMWSQNVQALVRYGIEACKAWTDRGHKDNCAVQITAYMQSDFVLPSWFGDSRFHRSHRANLLRKDRFFYGFYGWKEHPCLPYVWPTPDTIGDGLELLDAKA